VATRLERGLKLDAVMSRRVPLRNGLKVQRKNVLLISAVSPSEQGAI